MRPVRFAAWCLALQTALPRPAVLEGRVVRLGSGATVAHARIVAAKVGGSQTDYRTMVADEAGRFIFKDVTPGAYRGYASHDGYLQGEYGRRPPGASGIPVVLGEGHAAADSLISEMP